MLEIIKLGKRSKVKHNADWSKSRKRSARKMARQNLKSEIRDEVSDYYGK